jgi:hypothetical protein
VRYLGLLVALIVRISPSPSNAAMPHTHYYLACADRQQQIGIYRRGPDYN